MELVLYWYKKSRVLKVANSRNVLENFRYQNSRGLKVAQNFKKKVAGIKCRSKAQNKKSRGFNVAQKVKTKSPRDLMSRIMYARLYNFFNFMQIYVNFVKVAQFFVSKMKK